MEVVQDFSEPYIGLKGVAIFGHQNLIFMTNEPKNELLPVAISREDYLTNRVKNQIGWYSDKSGFFKRWNTRLKISTILFAALIPIVLMWPTGENIVLSGWLKVVGALLGSAVAAIESIQSFKKYGELAANYRMTSETLKRELLYFQTKTGDYSGDFEEKAAFAAFVNRCELIMTGENRNWLAIAKPVEKSPEKNDQSDASKL